MGTVVGGRGTAATAAVAWVSLRPCRTVRGQYAGVCAGGCAVVGMGASRPVSRDGRAVVGNCFGHRAGHAAQLLCEWRLGAYFLQRGPQFLHWQQRPVRRDRGDPARASVAGINRAAARRGRRDPAFGPISLFLCRGLGFYSPAACCLPEAAAVQVVFVLAWRRDWPQSGPLFCP